MKHFHQFLFLLAYLSASVLAYDLYGGYERMLYYYAYRMDVAKNGKAKTIGSGCKPAGGGSGPCNILDFVQFINNDGVRPDMDKHMPAGWDKDFPDANQAARALRDADATKAYNCNKIHTVLGRNDVEGAFKKVSEFVGGIRDAGPITDQMRAGAETAVDQVAKLRTAANLQSYGDDLKARFGEQYVVETKVNVFDNEEVTTLDPKETRKKIRTIPGQEKFNLGDDVLEWRNKDPGHADKVKMAASCGRDREKSTATPAQFNQKDFV
ncbi:hypothetical protein BR93DRAFT_969717 [Coniochaeta sp. PMI_546]|nr:hypothetical protein BR93DRAFT_969717 [Coniochaeta sp. PMI_546]